MLISLGNGEVDSDFGLLLFRSGRGGREWLADLSRLTAEKRLAIAPDCGPTCLRPHHAPGNSAVVASNGRIDCI